MPLKSNRKKKSALVSKASDIFLSKIRQVEKRVWDFVSPLLAGLNRENGRIKKDQFNIQQILTVNQGVLNVLFGTDGIASELPGYIEKFDQVEFYNRLIYADLLPEQLVSQLSRMTFSNEKVFLVDDITKNMTSSDIIYQQVVEPIRKTLYAGIAFRKRVSDVAGELRRDILTNPGTSSSRLMSYSRQIAQDAITQYDGAINDRIRDDLGLDGFYYVGATVRDSRENCVMMVAGSGIFADLAIRPGVYAVADIDTIISRASRGRGFNQRCTKETFGQYRMGYNCNHEIIYVLLDDEDVLKKVARSNP